MAILRRFRKAYPSGAGGQSLVAAWLPPAQSGTCRSAQVANRDEVVKDSGIQLERSA
jgi:hypothetical protein